MNLERQNRKGNGDHPHRTVLYRNKEKDLDRNKRTRSFKKIVLAMDLSLASSLNSGLSDS